MKFNLKASNSKNEVFFLENIKEEQLEDGLESEGQELRSKSQDLHLSIWFKDKKQNLLLQKNLSMTDTGEQNCL
ncbi:hypothetical protein Avbf_05073 [Armadillidium vulgare]|nr:hypothetical protein Avbf_05073 [Armadillidium vulgare]